LAMITPLGTATTMRVSKEAGEIPVLFPLTGTAGIRGAATPNTYFLRASYSEEVQRIVSHSKQVGMHRLALIHSNDAFGKSGLDAYEKALVSAQLKPGAIGVTADFRSKDVDAAVQTVVKSRPDAVLVYLPGTFTDTVIALRRAGLPVPIYGISVALTQKNIAQLGSSARGLMFTQVVPPFKVVTEYLALVEAAGLKPSFGGMEGFLTAKVVAEAIRRAGPSVDRIKLRRALDSMQPYDAGNFMVQFDPSTRSGSKFVQIGVVDATGNVLN
jgi:branched-chain amino acid transport system substrate-binding protein